MNTNYCDLATTDYGNVLPREQFFNFAIRALGPKISNISGPAFTVQLASGDNLMLHSAIYEAPEGSIVVVDGVDCDYAVAGGNVCAVAKERGIKGFIIDGVIRDLGEIIAMDFPVYAKGVFPVPGKKNQYFELGKTIVCGGVTVNSGDIIVADIEGIVCIPKYDADDIYSQANEKCRFESEQSLSQWQKNHQKKISQALIDAKLL